MNENQTHFDADELTIEVWTGDGFYSIDLEECTNSAQVLDWLLQLRGKQDYSPQQIEDVLVCLDEACRSAFGEDAQAVFCPGGQSRDVAWPRSG